jgi:hypothetical protein
VSWKKTRRDFSGWIWDERLRGGKFFEENFWKKMMKNWRKA